MNVKYHLKICSSSVPRVCAGVCVCVCSQGKHAPIHKQHPEIPPSTLFTFCILSGALIQKPEPCEWPTTGDCGENYSPPLPPSLSLSLSLLSLFTVPGVNADSSDLGVMEGRGHSVGGSDESPSEAEVLSEREERLTGAHDEQMSPDCSEDMEDSDSVASERLLSSGFRAEGLGLISSPDWALAFFGEECFSPDVIQYAGNLGQHTGSPCLDVKAQVGKATMATASESSLTLTLSVWTNGRCHDLFITFSCRLH